ncbi:MAG TPA: Fic/DOC family N-terminal domain-containing protein [Elusimicrobiales bacterium]|nr:Fic/DOC family N-terminal domain-containing protein [Elusimicrobiales bacterium]
MKTYIPEKLPIENLNNEKLTVLLDDASSYLCRYDGFLQNMLNPNILLSPLLRKEAEFSSRIEGTQSTTSEVLEYEAGKKFDKNKQKEVNVIRNYRYALIEAENYIAEGKPFSLSLLKQIHHTLMKDARWDGKNSKPGEFRNGPVHIGHYECKPEEATYIPPEHFLVVEYLENWEYYFKSYTQQNRLIKAAIIHAQFEIIHPFEDGNGRIGRMLITLFLHLSGIIKKPSFYISEYFEKNRTEYYYRLNEISKSKDWQGWIEFFLKAVKEQSRNNIKKTIRISTLYNEMKDKFQEATRSQHLVSALDLFFKRPILSSKIFYEKTKIHRATAYVLLNKLCEKGLIKCLSKGKGHRPSIYVLPSLINLIEDKDIF